MRFSESREAPPETEMEQNEKEANVKWVDLVEFDGAKGRGKVLVRAILDGGRVRFEGDAKLAAQLEKGVSSYTEQKRFMPEDGEQFLKAMGEEYRNGYLYATGVKSGDKAEPFEQPEEHQVQAPARKGPPPIPEDAK